MGSTSHWCCGRLAEVAPFLVLIIVCRVVRVLDERRWTVDSNGKSTVCVLRRTRIQGSMCPHKDTNVSSQGHERPQKDANART